jgi:hypothetical protein
MKFSREFSTSTETLPFEKRPNKETCPHRNGSPSGVFMDLEK